MVSGGDVGEWYVGPGDHRQIESIGYTQRTVNHSVSFVNRTTGDHTTKIEAMWRAVKDFLKSYNRRDGYEHHLAHYMFAARYRAQGGPIFNQFLAVVSASD
jgi:hypothetical protein